MLTDLLNLLGSQAGLILLAATCAFAWWKGGPPERFGSVMVALTWVGLLITQALTKQLIPEFPFMVFDGLLALGFLALAVRYASLWLGAAMLLQAALFSLHAAHLSGELQLDWINRNILQWEGFKGIAESDYYYYLLATNVLSYCVLLTLNAATGFRWLLKKGRQRRAVAASGLRPVAQSAPPASRA